MSKKNLKDLKDGDKIYILDIDNIEAGFVAYKVVDVSHEDEEWNDSGCGDPYTPERWNIHFTSPYNDRWVCVDEGDENIAVYNGTNVMNISGHPKTMKITMILASSLSGVKHYAMSYFSNLMTEIDERNTADFKVIDKLASAIKMRESVKKEYAEICEKIDYTL